MDRVVCLSPDDFGWCEKIARRRNSAKARAGIETSGTYDGRDSTYEMHLAAIVAEAAVAILTGGKVDTSVSTRGHRGGNIVLPDGRRANAKFRGKRGWDYAIKGDSPAAFYGELGFLVWPVEEGDLTQVEVVGWIAREQFARRATPIEWREGEPRLKVPAEKMNPLDMLHALPSTI